jgi:hypothetical protein
VGELGAAVDVASVTMMMLMMLMMLERWLRGL